jgi:hypothetical protein
MRSFLEEQEVQFLGAVHPDGQDPFDIGGAGKAR